MVCNELDASAEATEISPVYEPTDSPSEAKPTVIASCSPLLDPLAGEHDNQGTSAETE